MSKISSPMSYCDLSQITLGYLPKKQQEELFASAVLSGCRSVLGLMLSTGTGVKFDRGAVIKAAIESDSCAMVDYLIDTNIQKNKSILQILKTRLS